MNLQRLMSLPHALKPILAVILFISMISAGCVSNHTPGGWFFWLTTVIEFIFMVVIIVFFVMEIERILTCGRDSWPVAELIYTIIFFICTVINVFIVASWYSEEHDEHVDTSDHSTTTKTIVAKSGAAIFTAVSLLIRHYFTIIKKYNHLSNFNNFRSSTLL